MEVSWRVLRMVIAVCLSGSFHFGYQLSLVNPTWSAIQAVYNTSMIYHYQHMFLPINLTHDVDPKAPPLSHATAHATVFRHPVQQSAAQQHPAKSEETAHFKSADSRPPPPEREHTTEAGSDAPPPTTHDRHIYAADRETDRDTGRDRETDRDTGRDTQHFDEVPPEEYAPLQPGLDQEITLSQELNVTIMSKYLHVFFWGCTTGVLYLGGALGCLIFYPLSKHMGRLQGIIVSNFVILASVALQAYAGFNIFEFLVLGRFVAGIGIGIATGFQALFYYEIVDIKQFGWMASFTVCSIQLGMLASNLLGMPDLLGQEKRWVGLMFIESSMLIGSLIYICLFGYDSPVYLVAEFQHEDALDALIYYRETSEEACKTVLDRLKAECENKFEELSFSEIISHPASRRALVLSMLINLSVSFSGIISYQQYGTQVFEKATFLPRHAAWANAVVNSMGLVAGPFAAYLVHRSSRRGLVNTGYVLLLLLNIALVVVSIIHEKSPKDHLKYINAVLILIFCFVFNLTIGCVCWFISVEISPPESVSKITSYSLVTQYLSNFVVSIIYYPVFHISSMGVCMMFTVPNILIGIFIFKRLPETNGKTNEEVVLELEGEYSADSPPPQSPGVSNTSTLSTTRVPLGPAMAEAANLTPAQLSLLSQAQIQAIAAANRAASAASGKSATEVAPPSDHATVAYSLRPVEPALASVHSTVSAATALPLVAGASYSCREGPAILATAEAMPPLLPPRPLTPAPLTTMTTQSGTEVAPTAPTK